MNKINDSHAQAISKKGPSNTQNSCRQRHINIVSGVANKRYPLKSLAQTIQNAQLRIKKHFINLGQVEFECESLSQVVVKQNIKASGKVLRRSLPKAMQSNTADENNKTDGTLWIASAGLWHKFNESRFDAFVMQKFNPLIGPLNQAKKGAEAKYLPVVENLIVLLNRLQEIYKASIPRLISWVKAHNPNISYSKILQVVIQSLDEEMSEVLYVLGIYAEAFAQYFNGLYPQLQAVTDCLEDGFKLFETGDLEGCSDCVQKLKNRKFQVGNVFVVRLGADGPATFPAQGPIGAHAIEVPANEASIISIMLVLYLHELRHDLFSDVEGLAEEVKETVTQAITDAIEKKEIILVDKEIKTEHNKMPAVQLLVKLFSDTIGEIDADIAGGILMSGQSFLLNMLMTFVALNAQSESVFEARDHFRTYGFYSTSLDKDGGVQLEFEEHPPDYVRAYLCTYALDMIGFNKEAEYCRRRIDQAIGFKTPQFIEWYDLNGKSNTKIKIRWSDLKQVLPVVARAIMFAPLKSLGGLHISQVISWTEHREWKATEIAKLLMAGKSDIPDHLGDVYTTYIAAGATQAYWNLSEGGIKPDQATQQVERAALEMIAKLRERRKDRSN